MRVYILGICGTFMASLAVLAKEMGFDVAGCDENIYPPMSTQLAEAGITLDSGYNPSHINDKAIDLIVVGNALSRGNAIIEYMLNEGMHYTSGPQFLHDYVIKDKWVLAVSGTHGKTTTAAMLAWILEYSQLSPGFLVGGVLKNFPFSARLGQSQYFVIEADEYDTAFFDKRSKFIHYCPETLIINNIEFDHADIFNSIDDIKRQFHHLIRIVPSNGTVIYPLQDNNVNDVIAQGCWSKDESFFLETSSSSAQGTKSTWQAELKEADGSHFSIGAAEKGAEVTDIKWSMVGIHNVSNAIAAIAAAHQVGVPLKQAAEALEAFNGVKRRMELLAVVRGTHVYDDFAHHPTAIATSLRGMRQKIQGRLIAVIELASNTMKGGVHKDALKTSVESADRCFWYFNGKLGWQWDDAIGPLYETTEALLSAIDDDLGTDDHIVLMSNSGFNGFRQTLIEKLKEKHES